MKLPWTIKRDSSWGPGWYQFSWGPLYHDPVSWILNLWGGYAEGGLSIHLTKDFLDVTWGTRDRGHSWLDFNLNWGPRDD
jgi:hypothetical protein